MVPESLRARVKERNDLHAALRECRILQREIAKAKVAHRTPGVAVELEEQRPSAISSERLWLSGDIGDRECRSDVTRL
jgi:hypothetical protein